MVRKYAVLTENIIAGQSERYTGYAVLPIEDKVFNILRDNDIFLFLFKEFEIIPFSKDFRFVYVEDKNTRYIDIEEIDDPYGDFPKDEMKSLLEFLLMDDYLEGYFEIEEEEVL